MKHTSAAILALALLFSSCAKQESKDLAPHGLYKMEKIELKKDPDLAWVIDTSCQYWQFKKKSLKIFNQTEVQNILHIKMTTGSFQSVDANGRLMDEYFIKKIDSKKLELLSSQKVNDKNYYILYYLDKVEGSDESAVMKDGAN